MSIVIKGNEPFDVMVASNIVNCQTANIKFKNISFRCETIEDAEGTVFVKMPSAQPERTDCEYCHEDADGYVKPIEKNNHAFVRFGMNGWELDLKANGWHGSAKINYCPVCGRKLQRT